MGGGSGLGYDAGPGASFASLMRCRLGKSRGRSGDCQRSPTAKSMTGDRGICCHALSVGASVTPAGCSSCATMTAFPGTERCSARSATGGGSMQGSHLQDSYQLATLSKPLPQTSGSTRSYVADRGPALVTSHSSPAYHPSKCFSNCNP